MTSLGLALLSPSGAVFRILAFAISTFTTSPLISAVAYAISPDFVKTAARGLEPTRILLSMTFSGAYSEIDNVTGTATSDNSGYELNLSFTF